MRRLPRSSIRSPRRPAVLCLTLAALTALASAAGLCAGAVRVSPGEVLEALLLRQDGTLAARIVLYARLPRVLGGLAAGAALASSGVLIQSVLSNPLAAPNLIGVNAGAGFLTALTCAVLPASAWAAQAASFLGAFLGAALVLFVSERTGASRISLVLAGVAISSMFSAGIDAVVTLSPDALNGYSDFRVGGLAGVTFSRLAPAAAVAGAGFLAAVLLSGRLDILTLGAETAQSLGLPVRRTRLTLLLAAAALAGSAVSFAGLLGFVGLIVPQAMRRLMGEDSLPLLLSSALGGALLLTLCDLLARTVFRPYELPVGIVMSLLGGPFFLILLLRQRGGRIHD